MNNLEKIQKGMRVLQILSKIVLVCAIVGVALTSIAAVLVTADVLNRENQFFHFLSVTAEMSKGRLAGILTAAAISLFFGGVLIAFINEEFNLLKILPNAKYPFSLYTNFSMFENKSPLTQTCYLSKRAF